MAKLKFLKLTHDYEEQTTRCVMKILLTDYDVFRLIKLIDESRIEIMSNMKCADETRWLTRGLVKNNDVANDEIYFVFEDRQGDINKNYDKRIIRLVKLILSKSIFRYERLKQIEESKRLIGSRH